MKRISVFMIIFFIIKISFGQDSTTNYFSKFQRYKDYSYKGEEYYSLKGIVLNAKKVKYKGIKEINIYDEGFSYKKFIRFNQSKSNWKSS